MLDENQNPTVEKDWIDNSKVPDPELGSMPITGDRYYSKEFMEEEWDKLWTKVWLIAGLESQLKNPGDFITCDIGPESILCTKDKDGQILSLIHI